MKTVNRTYSIPIDIDRDLRLFIGRKHMSSFVAESIRKNLSERSKQLSEEYASAAEDEGQEESRKDWESTAADGLGEDNDW